MSCLLMLLVEPLEVKETLFTSDTNLLLCKPWFIIVGLLPRELTVVLFGVWFEDSLI